MKIEIATEKSDSNKAKGDLLENLAKYLLEAQGYKVEHELRTASAEIDLLCKHKVNSSKVIYVECKAHATNIPANVLRQLWGTVDFEEYQEGWLISTSEFTKDAKGFVEKWDKKDGPIKSRLSFYTPDLIIESLLMANVIVKTPENVAEQLVETKDNLGDWTLLVSSYGIYWCVFTLQGGAPFGVLVFNAKSGNHVSDELTLNNLSGLDAHISNYDLKVGLIHKNKENQLTMSKSQTSAKVIEVQTGDSWEDYRPARPQDFVGRDQMQSKIISFLENSKVENNSRIFAITGNSGLGKSSLIAKLRTKCRNKRYCKKFFTYAVDIRGAKDTTYIMSALLACLKSAQKSGFGDSSLDLVITDPISPLTSPAISRYLDSISKNGQVVCLIFDQFEELYSKPELFGIFTEAKNLMLDVAANKSSLCLGFAWKTDSTTHHEHPAYHLWHQLADLRKEFRLGVFNSSEISKSITTFEKSIGQKISAQSRRQISQSCQGFPWMLKKLCINLYEGIEKGESSESLLVDLDAKRLFQSDLDALDRSEYECLKLIASKAPADWAEIIELSGVQVLNNLVHKRLVIKSGDRLNIYWDIFKDYLLTGKVPDIPFTYIPSTDINTLIKVCNVLELDYGSSEEISQITGLGERTVLNVVGDLVMFGLAERKQSQFKLHKDIGIASKEIVIQKIRERLKNHSLKVELYKKWSGKTISDKIISQILKTLLSSTQHISKPTIKLYTNRMLRFLVQSGFLLKTGSEFVVQDLGEPIYENVGLARRGAMRGKVFSVSTSPYSVCNELQKLLRQDNKFKIEDISRNALSVLKRFELVVVRDNVINVREAAIRKHGGAIEAVWALAKTESSFLFCIEAMNQTPMITTVELAQLVASEFDLNWSKGSLTRNGSILKQWSSWVKDGLGSEQIPIPPGRK